MAIITTSGVDATLKAQGKLRGKVERVIDETLKKCADIVWAAADKLVPVETSLLRDSARVVGNGKKGFACEWVVMYSTHYAWPVHEDLNAQHAPPTQAKYLITAVNRTRGVCAALLRRNMNAAVRGRFN